MDISKGAEIIKKNWKLEEGKTLSLLAVDGNQEGTHRDGRYD